jgi:hypothetical protein
MGEISLLAGADSVLLFRVYLGASRNTSEQRGGLCGTRNVKFYGP